MKVLKGLVFALIFGSTFLGSAQKSISIDTQKSGEQFDHYWSKMVGAGRANEGL